MYVYESTPATPALDALRRAERFHRNGRLRDAELIYRELVTELRLQPRSPRVVYGRVRYGLARVLAAQHRNGEAEEAFARAIAALTEGVEGPASEAALCLLELSRALVSYSNLRHRAGARDAAETLFDRAMRDALRRAISAWEAREWTSDSVANALNDMAEELRAAGRAGCAERVLRLELAERERLEQDVRTTSRVRIQLARCLMDQGRLGEAERMFHSALEQRIAAGLPADATTKARCWLANCLLMQERPERAEQLLLEGLSALRGLDEHPKSRAAIRYTLARVTVEQGRDAEAKEILRKGLEDLERAGPHPNSAALFHVGLAKLLHAEGAHDAAEATLLRAMDTKGPKPLHSATVELVREELLSFRRAITSGSSLSAAAGRTTLCGLVQI